MDAVIDPVVAALASVDDGELDALIAATYDVPQTALGLFAWIDGAREWELNRRDAFDSRLPPPKSATDPSEDAFSTDAAIVMRDAGNVCAGFTRRRHAAVCALAVVNRSRWMSAAAQLNVGSPEGRWAAQGRAD